MAVTAATVATVAVPATNDVGAKKSVAATKTAARKIDGTSDMAVSVSVVSAGSRGLAAVCNAAGDDLAPSAARLRLAMSS
jgi:hypothetical protein